MRGWWLVWLVGCQEYALVVDEVPEPEGPRPALEVTPPALDFGVVDRGDAATELVTVRNVGEGPLTVWSIALDAPGPFTLAALTDDVLYGGDEAEFAVTFAPETAGVVTGTARVRSDAPVDPDATVALAGESQVLAHDVSLLLTVDDAWTGWLDGVAFTAPNQNDWFHADLLEWTLESGTHVLAIHGRDASSVVSGLIAVLTVDGVPTSLTGDAAWRMTSSDPGPSWSDPQYDDTGWPSATVCANQTTWGTYWPAAFLAEGAEWVWWTSNCGDLQQAWFRLTFTLE